MPSRLEQFFSTNFLPPHGYCFLWMPEIVWLHVISNLLIASSYFSIPFALWHFARKRPDMPFRNIFLLFATFITLCGVTHLFGIAVLWWPAYGYEGIVMFITGITSAATAFVVWKIMPLALTLPSPLELEKINRQLGASFEETERKVQARTAELELANHALMMSRMKADAANAAKTDFLATMSHEIRTPMNAVVGITHLLGKQPLSEKQAMMVSTLQTSAGTLLDLINDLLDIEKIEAQDTALEHHPFNVVAVVETVMGILRQKAAEKKLEFTLDLQCEGIGERQFYGDALRLRQVVLNLCSNAIKFTEKGSVSITIMCDKMPNLDAEMVKIAVKDTGIGIEESMRESIFEKFVQADSSISRKYGGTGLGLAIVSTLVARMGGEISLESMIGKGTTFMLALPLPIAPAATA